MSLREEVRADLRSTTVQPFAWKQDPRGDEWGSAWVKEGAPIECAYQELTTTERYESGRQESDRMLRLFVDLGPAPDRAPPLTERMQVELPNVTDGDRRYDVTSVVSVVAGPDYGAMVEVVSV